MKLGKSGNAAVMTPGKWHGYEAAFFVQHLGYTPRKRCFQATALSFGVAG